MEIKVDGVSPFYPLVLDGYGKGERVTRQRSCRRPCNTLNDEVGSYGGQGFLGAVVGLVYLGKGFTGIGYRFERMSIGV